MGTTTYCSVQDIEGYYLGKSFECGDYLTNGEADGFILSDAAIINATLKVKYTLPITNTNDLLILKSINEKMVVGTIDDVFREKKQDGTFDRGHNTRKEALEMLKLIRKGELILESAEGTSPIKFNKIDSDGETVEPRFKDSNIDKY